MSETIGRWLTYEELGQLIGRTPNGARMFATRRSWPKRSSNRIGERATILVPADIAESPSRAAHGAEQKGSAVPATETGERAIARAAIDALTEQLAIANRRLDEERACSERAIARAATAEQQASDLQARLDAETEERCRLTTLLTDQRAALAATPPPRRWWWQRRFP